MLQNIPPNTVADVDNAVQNSPEFFTYILSCADECERKLGLTSFIKPRRKTPGFRHGDMRRVPFLGLVRMGFPLDILAILF